MGRNAGFGLAAAMVLGTFGLAPALAQSASDFKLQPRETSTPRSQGPVDSDAPVVRPVSRPTPSEAPLPAQPSPVVSTPAAAPFAGQRPAATGAPAQPRTQSGAVARPSQPAPARSLPAQAAPALASPVTSLASGAVPDTSASSDSQVPAVIETLAPAPGNQSRLPFDIWWLAIPAVALLILAVWLMRRGKSVDETEEYPVEATVEHLAETNPAPQPSSADLPTPALGLAKTPPPAKQSEATTAALPPIPASAPADMWSGEKLAISLEVGRMSATLMNCALTWKLKVENRGDAQLGPVAVAGDMVAAHASRPVDQQLATDGQPLELIRNLPPIAPGEQAEISGEFRVPLSAINPIKAGSALLFIPLLRFRVDAEDAGTLATFAVGETPPVAAAALLPFRLDLGPRVWQRISHRQVDRPVISA